MSSYRQILYHIIFRTKEGRLTLSSEHQKELFAYIMGIIKNKNCFLYRINGMKDHLHLLSDLHPTVALADYVRDIVEKRQKKAQIQSFSIKSALCYK